FYITEISYTGPSTALQAPTHPELPVKESFQISSLYDLQVAWSYLADRVSPSEGSLLLKGHVVELHDPQQGQAEPVPPEEQSFTLAWTQNSESMPQTLADAGLRSAELVIIEVIADSPAERLGLQVGDRITGLNGQEILSFSWFKNRLQKLAAEG